MLNTGWKSTGRPYSEADFALFASYRDQRARCRPLRCTGGSECWVEHGSPACTSAGCVECHAMPLALSYDDLRHSNRRL